MATANHSAKFNEAWESLMDSIKLQIESRGYRVSNEMRNSALLVLRGQRSGKRYKVPGTYRRQRDKMDGKMKNGRYYTASAPGEAPAVRTGAYRLSWHPSTYATSMGEGEITVVSQVESTYRVRGHVLGDLLEEGTSRMAPRPHVDDITEKSEKAAMRIYREPYF